MIRKTVTLTDPHEQRQAAAEFIRLGGVRHKTLAKAVTITGKRARKLLRQARREGRTFPTGRLVGEPSSTQSVTVECGQSFGKTDVGYFDATDPTLPIEP